MLKRLVIGVIGMAPASDARVLAAEPIGPRVRGAYYFCHPETNEWQPPGKDINGEAPALGERFTFHDLRAKCASDKDGLERAAALLGHANSQTTKSVYRRKMPRATPLG